MPYDADLVLRGKYGTTYSDLITADTANTSTTVNDHGNIVVDLGDGGGTGALGLDCIVIMHDDPTTYSDTCAIVIQDSDQLDDGWHALLTFPTLYAYMIEVTAVATVAFPSTTIGEDLTATTNQGTGVVRHFSRKLQTVGGIGKLYVMMENADDDYDEDGDLLAADGAGRGTQIGLGRPIMRAGHTMVRRLSTPKRYLRCSITVSGTGDWGDVDILLTGSQHSHVNNLLM